MWESVNKIKYYIITMMLAMGGYMYTMYSGTRILGDDRLEEERTTQGGNRFYHK